MNGAMLVTVKRIRKGRNRVKRVDREAFRIHLSKIVIEGARGPSVVVTSVIVIEGDKDCHVTTTRLGCFIPVCICLAPALRRENTVFQGHPNNAP